QAIGPLDRRTGFAERLKENVEAHNGLAFSGPPHVRTVPACSVGGRKATLSAMGIECSAPELESSIVSLSPCLPARGTRQTMSRDPPCPPLACNQAMSCVGFAPDSHAARPPLPPLAKGGANIGRWRGARRAVKILSAVKLSRNRSWPVVSFPIRG